MDIILFDNCRLSLFVAPLNLQIVYLQRTVSDATRVCEPKEDIPGAFFKYSE
jgi:hypothetical protein